MKRVRKISFRAAIVLVSFFLVLMAVLSPLAKYLIEKYDKQITGREITLDWALVSPFNGYIYLNNVDIREQDGVTAFLSMNGLSVNFSLWKLIRGDYEMTSVTLNEPVGYVKQGDSTFNFTDIIEHFAGDTTEKKKEKTGEPARVSLLDIRIRNGEFHYLETVTPISYYISNVNIESEGWRTWVDSLALNYEFTASSGGTADGYFCIHTDDLDFAIDARLHQIDLDLINQYMKGMSRFGTMSAMMEADLKSVGNFQSVDSMEIRGDMSIFDFHFGKSREVDFVFFERLVIGIEELSPKRLIYHFDSIVLDKPYCSYELYDSLDNIQTMFGAGGAEVANASASAQFNLILEIAKGVEQLSKNFLASHYRIKSLAINEGDFHYTDYTMGQKFDVAMYPFFLHADSIDKAKTRVNLDLSSKIYPYGDFKLALSINPQDSSNFDLQCRLTQVPLTVFNPYFVDLTSYPFDRGTLEFIGSATVREARIQSENHLLILDPRLSQRIKNEDSRWLPTPLAMAILRENGDVIDYTVPIEGNLNDPDFKLKDVILDILTNIFVKPITTPYRVEVRNAERAIEKSLSLQWPMHGVSLGRKQEKAVRKIADFLEDNPSAVITVNENPYVQKEKELILLFEAKKLYFLATNNQKGAEFSDDDSVFVAKMSVKDPGFMAFLKSKVPDALLFTVQHRAERLVDSSLVITKMAILARERRTAFLEPFKEEGVAGRVRFAGSGTAIPYNGFSFYSISYTGGFPEYLHEAFEKMDDFDNTQPRLRYKKKREGLRLRFRRK